MKTSLLFVDDDPFILDALRRQLRRFRTEWDVEFASAGQEALGLMEQTSFDIVVSDMRMPGMDGSELLTEVMRRHPRTVRIILSGQSEREVRFETLAPAHQYLSKPCDLEALREVIDYATQLRSYLPNEELCSVVSSIATLPALPRSVEVIRQEFGKEEPSTDAIVDAVVCDPCLSAEVLQLANSPFFGAPGSAIHPREAVGSLGPEMVSQLVERSLRVNESTEWAESFSFDGLASRSLEVARVARSWMCERSDDLRAQEAAATAGLLHGIGEVVLSISLPDLYEEVLARVQAGSDLSSDVESRELGTTSAQIGGYLLRLWRLPESIVDAVTYQDEPDAIAGEATVLAALRAGIGSTQ